MKMIFSFSILLPFYIFSECMSNFPRLLNECGENEHPCLVPDCRISKVWFLLVTEYDTGCVLVVKDFIILKKILLSYISILLQIFIVISY